MSVSVYACMCTCMYACMCVRVCVCVCAHTLPYLTDFPIQANFIDAVRLGPWAWKELSRDEKDTQRKALSRDEKDTQIGHGRH